MSVAIERDPGLEAQKAEWLAEVESRLAEVEGWAKARGWQTRRFEREVTEDLLGAYTAPALEIEIERPQGRIVMEPVGRNVLGATGRIDLYVWPALFRVKLLRSARTGEWLVRTDSGVNLPGGWSEAAFLALVSDWLSEDE
jgi:hypothetical protein